MPFIGFLAIRWNVDGIDNSIIIYWPLALYEVQHSSVFVNAFISAAPCRDNLQVRLGDYPPSKLCPWHHQPLQTSLLSAE
jgi:hypothetical protein